MSDLCEDCLKPKANRYKDWEARAATLCGAHLVSEGARLQCAEIKLERVVDENEKLRSDLTSANERADAAANESRRLAGLLEVERERAAAEQVVLDIVINWRRKDLSLECGPSCGCLDCLADSVDELLALRAGEKAE